MFTGSVQEALHTLETQLGHTAVITDPTEVSAASLDGRGRRQGRAIAIIRPNSTDEVALTLKVAAQYQLIVITQGGNTSNVGGATPEPTASNDDAARTLILQLGRMRRILEVDPINNTIRLEAGVILQDAQAAAEQVGRLLALSLAAEGSCQIGGVIATNAGGVHVLRYGMARRQVLGLKIVTASGEVLDLMRELRKDNSGYSLKDLFVGSEGTLGVITEAILTIEPMPRSIVSAWVTPASLAHVEPLFEALETACGPGLTAFELIGRSPLASLEAVTGLTPPIETADWQVLLDLSDWQLDRDEATQRLEGILTPLLEKGIITNGAVSYDESDREAFWQCRESIPSAVKRQGGNVKHDISVPRSKLTTFIQETVKALQTTFPGVEPSIFGHFGDGNLHFNVGPGSVAFPHEEAIHRLVRARVLAVSGSIAAEHGVGSLKTDELARTKSPEELAAFRALKRAFDPDNRLNPGRIVRL